MLFNLYITYVIIINTAWCDYGMSKGLFVLADILGAKWGDFSLFIYTPRAPNACIVQLSNIKHFKLYLLNIQFTSMLSTLR